MVERKIVVVYLDIGYRIITNQLLYLLHNIFGELGYE